MTPKDLIKTDVRPAKKAKLSGPTKKLKPVFGGEAFDNLMAVANFMAEVEKSKLEKRDVNYDESDSLFNKDFFKWQKKKPKNMFVLWFSQTSDGAWEHHADEVALTNVLPKIR